MTAARVLAADWSGALRTERRALWVAEMVDGRVSALFPATREEVERRCLTLARADPRLIVGLDFAFSVPAWWATRCEISDVGELWGDADRLERWLLDCRPPFWGRPGRRRPDLRGRSPWRQTELACEPRPRSVFQVGGAGSVGTGSLRGMPMLGRLRAAGFAVWPFDDWRLPVVVEAWPRRVIGDVVKSNGDERARWLADAVPALPEPFRRAAAGSSDAFDAVAAALGLWRDQAPRPAVDDPTIRLEGWIDGVPFPAS